MNIAIASDMSCPTNVLLMQRFSPGLPPDLICLFEGRSDRNYGSSLVRHYLHFFHFVERFVPRAIYFADRVEFAAYLARIPWSIGIPHNGRLGVLHGTIQQEVKTGTQGDAPA
jgi:hypothetical protein